MFRQLCTELMKTAKIRKKEVVALDEEDSVAGSKKKCCRG